MMNPHPSSIAGAQRFGTGGPGWAGAVMAIVTVMIANSWSSTDVKTVLLALQSLIAVHAVVHSRNY